ncbi:MAG TPA: TonB-dependent receptor [Vicinamibacterales bacterium]|nr:TonB-dependent receptor [Vicinamibacterales bacterium]
MRAVVRLLSLAVLIAAPVAAQEYRANLRGRISNPDGSPAARTTLVVVSESTGETRRVTSDADGRYAVAGLLPGVYTIEASGSGRSKFSIRTSVSISQDRELNLRPGLVPITAEADVRPTFIPADRSPLLPIRMSGSFITRLPLDGRNVLDVVLLAPGTAPGAFAIVSNGLPDLFTGYLVDGIYDIDPRLGMPAVRPQLDSIDEMEVRSFPLKSSFGRTAGAQISVVTKSGTNELHGGALAFFRSDANRAQLGGFAGGPIAHDRTFFFGNYEFSDDEGDTSSDSPSHLAHVRFDHIVGGSAHVAARYALDEDGILDRTGQNGGVSFHATGGSLANETRAGLSRISYGEASLLAEFSGAQTYQLSNVTTVPLGGHLLSGGGEWHGARELDADHLATVWGLFLQDDFRALPSLSVTVGARFDRAAAADSDESDSGVSPRVGVAWAVDREGQTVVRAGYGLARNYAIFDGVTPSVDEWRIGVQRQMGRSRSFEAAYMASRGEDLTEVAVTSRYDAMQLQFEQRSETGLTTVTSYTYGKWTESFSDADDPIRSPLDSRHRLVSAIAERLPFGKDGRWFTKGTAAKVLGDMELTGIFTLQTGRPLFFRNNEQGDSHRALDGALIKTVRLGERHRLLLRAEVFNLTNRENPLGPGRRYQLGGRFLF